MDSIPLPIIIEHVDHPWLEYTSWVAQIILVAVAIIAAVVARNQLKEMTDFRKQRVRILNATLIMELDHRWDAGEIREARALFLSIREEITKAVSNNNPLDGDHAKMEKAKAEWKSHLAGLRKDDRPKYQQLIGLCGFFESVGMMVKREYISKDDAMGLFGGSIVAMDRCFREHLEDRAKEMGVPKGFFEHALYLGELAKSELSR